MTFMDANGANAALTHFQPGARWSQRTHRCSFYGPRAGVAAPPAAAVPEGPLLLQVRPRTDNPAKRGGGLGK